MFFKNRKSLIACFAIILTLLSGVLGSESIKSVRAATLMVVNTNDSGAGSLRQAIIDAAPGDTINFDPSLAGQTIVLGSEINLDKDLIIDGSGLNPAVEISGNLALRIFYVTSNSTVTLESLLLKDGRGYPGSDGGAIFNNGNLTIRNSTFINNVTVGRGGAIYSSMFILNLSHSTFISNSASSGGAIYIDGGIFSNPISGPMIVNNTFVSNQASTATGSGGGIYSSWNGSTPDNFVVLVNNTFSGNSAHTGGGLYNWGSLFLINNIFANSTSGGDCVSYHSGTTAPNGLNNLIEDGISCYMGDFLSGDPSLGPLADNGGPTLTMALLPGSPAIDAGTATCHPTDQRGMTRPQGSGCDIGAYEVYNGAMSAGETVRVSTDAIGMQADRSSSDPALSADGQLVVFGSSATNLVAGDTNAMPDIFVRDLQTGITTRVSVDSNGAQANGGSSHPFVSADGRYVLFESEAANLVPDDTNGKTDVFIHDRQSGVTARLSVDASGEQANDTSFAAALSADGNYAAFSSKASNLVPDDTNGAYDIFVRNLQTGTVARVSVDSNGGQANGTSFYPSLSGDGHYITFESDATNLVPGDTNGIIDVFVHDVQAGTTTRISVSSSGMQGDKYSANSSISTDGRYVVFHAIATTLVPGDTNGATDVFVHDLQMSTTRRVSVDSHGAQGNGGSQNPVISEDGHYIVFDSCATNLIPNDDGLCDVFVHDLQSGATARVSVASGGVQANGFSSHPSVSADGQYIAFDSSATNLVSGDTNDQVDIFVHRQAILPIPPTDTPTFTPTVTDTPTNTPTFTPTFTPTITMTPTITPSNTPTATPTNTATYTPTITNTPSPTFTPTNTFTPTATPPYSYHPLYLSLTNSQTIGGIASSDEDILKFDGQNWSLFFDGSDVGVGSPDLFAFSLLDADTILMSFSANVTVNGITATPQDVLRFDATSLGSTTAGTFSLYFDGSDVGLSTTAENIDALSLLPDGRLLLSTTGNPSVPGLTTGRDEDVLAFTPTSLGSVTSGIWSLYFDGSDVGLAESSNEDLDALDVVGENIYLSTLGGFSVSGLSGADEDVFVCAATSTGDVTACEYSPVLYFDGSTWGLTGNDVDAFHFLMPPHVVPTNPAITFTP